MRSSCTLCSSRCVVSEMPDAGDVPGSYGACFVTWTVLLRPLLGRPVSIGFSSERPTVGMGLSYGRKQMERTRETNRDHPRKRKGEPKSDRPMHGPKRRISDPPTVGGRMSGEMDPPLPWIKEGSWQPRDEGGAFGRRSDARGGSGSVPRGGRTCMPKSMVRCDTCLLGWIVPSLCSRHGMACVQHGPVHPSSDVDERVRLFIQPRVFPCNIQAFVRRTRVRVQDVVSKACTFPRLPRRTRVRVSCSCESPDVRYAHVDVPWFVDGVCSFFVSQLVVLLCNHDG